MPQPPTGKLVVYQAFTRLFGNSNPTNKPWGSIEENGVGKFKDFDDAALKAIKNYGVSHIWYTGVPHHASTTHYEGITPDHPSVVKGRAGSPYAIKDYYNVHPDLAVNPANRLAEFEALIERTHTHGMKVIIDIVPNHVARNYRSISSPEGVTDFGTRDNIHIEYHRDNNFYYILGQAFKAPTLPEGHTGMADHFNLEELGHFLEYPAKWTGNGHRSAQPDWDDWYETVKINYGIKPDGTKDFAELPKTLKHRNPQAHQDFWAGQSVPDSWKKFKDITRFWLNKGVDGFRYDMAEMVPVEFWSYLNSDIKCHHPDSMLIAEIYQPERYREYLVFGLMDYLYDKVDTYDTLKAITQESLGTDQLDIIQQKYADINCHLLRFLENHDEHRIASPKFAGSAQKGWPAMVTTALLGQGPTLLYFGQAQGEQANQAMGFDSAHRTSIFDYGSVPAHQAWMNNGRFDRGGLSTEQLALDSAYQRLLDFSANEPTLHGDFISLHSVNIEKSPDYDHRCYSFIRHNDGDWLLVFVNFDHQPRQCHLHIPHNIQEKLTGAKAKAKLSETINDNWHPTALEVSEHGGLKVEIDCKGLAACALKLSHP